MRVPPAGASPTPDGASLSTAEAGIRPHFSAASDEISPLPRNIRLARREPGFPVASSEFPVSF